MHGLFGLPRAVVSLHRGGIVAYPTEGVWGLGCDPDNEQAVLRLLKLKRRSLHKGLIVVAANIEQLDPYLAGLAAPYRDKLTASWPGPITWCVPDNGYAPSWIRGEHNTVALRVSAHPLVMALCQAFAAPIVSTSANRASLPPARWHWQVQRQFGRAIDVLLNGALGNATRPSTIRDLISDQVWR